MCCSKYIFHIKFNTKPTIVPTRDRAINLLKRVHSVLIYGLCYNNTCLPIAYERKLNIALHHHQKQNPNVILDNKLDT